MYKRQHEDLTLVTLGPAGTNHEWIANRYLVESGQTEKVLLVESFDEALSAWKEQLAQMILICAAHPDYTDLMATVLLNLAHCRSRVLYAIVSRWPY